MAHHTEQAGAPNLPLVEGMTLKLEARSTSTDAEVTGVTASRWMIYGYNVGAAGGDIGSVLPVWVAEE